MSENQPEKRTAPLVASGFIYDDAVISASYVAEYDVIALYVFTEDHEHTVANLHLTPAAARQLVRKVGDAFIREAIKTGEPK